MRFSWINIGVWPDEGWRLQWTIEGITSAHEIVIERASSPEGPFEEIDIVDHNTVAYSDSTLPIYRGFHTLLFYKLVVRNKSDEVTVLESDPQTIKKAGDRITSEIIRQHELLLRGANSHPGFGVWDAACFKRTKYGTPCTTCIDPLTKERGRLGNCPTCKGTGYLEGWSNPITFRARWLTSIRKVSMIEVHGPSEEITRQGWTAAYPILEPGDVLVEKGTGTAWKVRNIDSSEPNGTVTSQAFTASAIDKQKQESGLFYPGEESA